MRKIILVSSAVLLLSACKSKPVLGVTDRLPKDISQKPERQPKTLEEQMQHDMETMQKISAEIDELSAEVNCTNPDEWRISPFGSKACGGPASFIAYPIKLEDDILPKIVEYNRRSSEYNLKYGIISDCAVTPAPSGIRCENGKAVLIYESQIVS